MPADRFFDSWNVSLVESGSAAQFFPNCDPGAAVFENSAWAMYKMRGVVYGEDIHLQWNKPASGHGEGDLPSYYIGVGDIISNTWDWYPEPALGSINIDEKFDEYVFEDGSLLLTILVVGYEMWELLVTTSDPGLPETANGGLFLLHHEVGQGLIDGGVRDYLTNYNQDHEDHYRLWDHGYNAQGLCLDTDHYKGTYKIPNDNTEPDGLYYLWTSPEIQAMACRSQIFNRNDVIAFMSSYTASAIESDEQLQQYQQRYSAMLPEFDAHPNRVFVVMSTPPLHRLATDADDAARARAFANWLKSDDYLSGHPNVVCFDLFDALAAPEDDTSNPNMLRYDYEGDHETGDSLPNSTANNAIAPVFAQFLIDASLNYAWPS